MADCHLIVLWTALLCTPSHWAGEAVQIITVPAVSMQCGSLHTVRGKDTFRIIMPENHTCPSVGFTCAIHFTASSRSTFQDKMLCVDFSRLHLAGAGTRLTISSGRQGGETLKVLTEFEYPLRHKIMGSTTKCISLFSHHYLTLTFKSDCHVPGYTLRDYFVSWVYVYMQPSEDRFVYYLDGTCRHGLALTTWQSQLTVRSLWWQDAASEPPLQNCSLYLRFFSSTSQTVQLCTTWRVSGGRMPCQVSAHLSFLDTMDYSRSRNVSCSAGTGAHGADHTCVDFGQLGNGQLGIHKAVFNVIRNENVGVGRELGDGHVLFEVDVSLKKLHEIKNTDSDKEIAEEDPNITVKKILFPLALLFSVCSCICGVSQKRAKDRQQQLALSGVEGAGGSLMTTAGQQDHSHRGSTSEPRTTPPLTQTGMVRHGLPWSTYRADSQADQGLAAPPPAYADRDHVPLVSLGGSRDAGGLGTTVPLHDDEASSSPWPVVDGGGDSLGPPPPISHGPSGAPPAYHDLFPASPPTRSAHTKTLPPPYHTPPDQPTPKLSPSLPHPLQISPHQNSPSIPHPTRSAHTKTLPPHTTPHQISPHQNSPPHTTSHQISPHQNSPPPTTPPS